VIDPNLLKILNLVLLQVLEYTGAGVLMLEISTNTDATQTKRMDEYRKERIGKREGKDG